MPLPRYLNQSRSTRSKKPKVSASQRSTTRNRLAVLGVLLILALVGVLYGLGVFSGSSISGAAQTSTSSTTSSSSYNLLANSVFTSAAGYIPGGYVLNSQKQFTYDEPGLLTAEYTTYTNQAGSFANMTVIVFSSSQSAQTYGTSVIDNAKALSGYTDVTSSLAPYQQYGVCYGYAEADPEGLEYVANGVCTKDNVYIFVHIASNISLPIAEGDMTGFVGAAYHGLS